MMAKVDKNAGTKMGLSHEQHDSLEIQRLVLEQKPKVIKNEKEFNRIWQDED